MHTFLYMISFYKVLPFRLLFFYCFFFLYNSSSFQFLYLFWQVYTKIVMFYSLVFSLLIVLVLKYLPWLYDEMYLNVLCLCLCCLGLVKLWNSIYSVHVSVHVPIKYLSNVRYATFRYWWFNFNWVLWLEMHNLYVFNLQ